MKKVLLLSILIIWIAFSAFSQTDKSWTANTQNKSAITTDKAVSRLSYPVQYKLFNLNIEPLRTALFSIVDHRTAQRSIVISLPNADGGIEQFEVFEASNFEPALQAQFPDIRAYSGKGITDKYASLKLSISPQGIQTMVFRTDKDNEFIEPYSKDHSVYSVYRSNREKGKLPWTCTTDEKQMASDIQSKLPNTNLAGSSTGQLKTMRLAQSCNGEYANYFGATSAAQVGLVLAAFNATLTRCNGCYEKDLALHLNLIANTASVIYYTPSTDPYTTLANWNLQLQQTLTSVIGNANYDIGHMFGASGGGGNAGCIGCVCVDPVTSSSLAKGAGITSPADGIPMGDNFDIDYVVHEVGHQLGANHTFSFSLEGTGQNKEIGSGITIMGYAGITAQDVAPHSIEIYHEASIAQIQANLATKTCPVSVDISANNTAPVIAVVSNYTIPISTPFVLTGSATDINGDPITYCWEQNDNSTTSGTASVASPTKTTGPNWLSFSPTASPTRTFPKLSTILAGLLVTGPLPGGDPGTNIEALSSVSRTLNFRLTVRDNSPFIPDASVGQTAFTDMVVTVTNSSGPFQVTAPNTNITWDAGSTATVIWSVNGTTGAPVNCASVNILLSTDGGNSFPVVLAAATPNDGSELITVPVSLSSTCRIKVEAVGNIFFDISNTNFTIGAPPACANISGLASTAITQNTATIGWASSTNAISYDADYKLSTSSTWINAATAIVDTTVNLAGLSAGTVYDWRVRMNCTAGTGNYVQSQFTTVAAPVTCPGIYDISTNGTTSGAATIPFNTAIFGMINVSNDNDYYKFVISTGGTISISLTNLPANYQLRLLNSSGSTLQTSSNSGTTNELINRTVTPGTYYVRVYPANSSTWNATSCYTLNVQTITAARPAGIEITQPAANEFSIYPNPASNMVNLLMNAPRNQFIDISIVNQVGSIVMAKSLISTEQSAVYKLDVHTLPNGMYFIRVKTGDSLQMAKLLIKK